LAAQNAESAQNGQTLASIREEQTAKELYAAIREWCKAGKPHKR